MKRFDNKQVLIVDDEISLREILAEEFVEEGATAFQAGNAFEALVIIKTNVIDAIVSDIRMHGGDGVMLIDKLRENSFSRPPLIFMTGFSDLTIQEAYQKGAEAVFSKPFKLNTIKDKVFQLMATDESRFLEKSDKKPSLEIDQNYKNILEASQQGKMKLGRGGVFIEGKHSVKVNDLVQFKIHFAAEKLTVLEGQGVVRWKKSGIPTDPLEGISVEFTFLSEACRPTVASYLSNLRDKAYIPVGIA